MKSLPQNLWKSPVIKNRLIQEACFESNRGIAEKPHYWCMVPFADSGSGVQVLKNYKNELMDCDPHEMQQVFAKEIMENLQSKAHFDGLWLVGFTHPPTSYGVITDTENCWQRLIMIWHDEDGDPQYTLESDLDFIKQAEAGADYYVGLAYKAHEQWKAMYGRKAINHDMSLRGDQVKKAALEALK